jgi:ribokinase
MVSVVCAGHVNWDVTLYVDRFPGPDEEARIDDQRSAGGGSAANVAVALSGLDVDSGVVGAVGDDENGHLVRRGLDRAGVDREHLLTADAPTTTKYLMVADDGEVAVLGNEGANEAVAPADVDPAYVRDADHLHLTSQRPETAVHLAELARETGATVSFDPGRRLGEREFDATLSVADVVFVNDVEAESLLESRDGTRPDGQAVVVKHGEAGAEVRTPEGTYAHPGFEVTPVDTTGAGDAFAAGFVATRLGGGDYERALEFANACGALAAREAGARTAPDRATVEGFLDEQFPA